MPRWFEHVEQTEEEINVRKKMTRKWVEELGEDPRRYRSVKRIQY